MQFVCAKTFLFQSFILHFNWRELIEEKKNRKKINGDRIKTDELI